jgi:predicted LPLAT superfamily acyltransferase
MAKWTGQSKGSLLGYKIFAFLIKKGGLLPAYFVLRFVALYYFLFSWKSNKAIFYYFRKRMAYNLWKSICSVYKSYYVFGQTLIDRVVISMGMIKKFTYEFDGIDNVFEALNSGSGGIFISAHVGNFEISEYFFEDGHKDIIINVLTTDLERENIKNYLESLSIQSKAKYFTLSNDLSHVFTMHEALSRNEFICVTGDRYIDGSKYFESQFLGEVARFPAGPFMIASKLRVPVIFVYVMKDSNSHYHLYGRRATVDPKNPKVLFDSYVENLTWLINKYPHQWFNYFDFWNKEE